MKLRHICLSGAILSALVLGGCGNDNTPSSSTPPQTPTTPPTETPAAPAPAPAAAPEATPAQPAAPAPGAPGAAAVPEAPATPAAPTTMPDMTQTPATDMQAKANTLIEQGIEYVKANKMDLAKKAVDQLEQMKPNLPASYGPRIDQLKAMLDAAQMKNGNLPGGMKLPGQ